MHALHLIVNKVKKWNIMWFSERKLLIINPTITILIAHQDHVSVGAPLRNRSTSSSGGELF